MNATVELLNKHKINYTVDENGKITVGGLLDLLGLTSIPDGFNPTVGGSLYLLGLTSIPDGFNPTVGGSLYLSGKLNAKTKPLPEDFGFHLSLKIEAKFNVRGFTIADGILARILSKRGNAKKVQVIGKKEASWLASDGEGNNAHGRTLHEAAEELRFKTASRDIEQYRNMPLDTVNTPQEWAFIYRAITGACQSGTAHFMGQHELNDSYTLSEIIEKTRGAFGHDRFVEITK